TYLSFHLRRLEATLDPRRLEKLEDAEAEAALALRAWQSAAGGVDHAKAAALEDEVRAYAAALLAQHGLVEELAELPRRLAGEARPALAEAADPLLAVLDPYGLTEDDLVSGPDFVRGLVLNHVLLGVRARAQAEVDELEAAREEAEAAFE